MNHKPTVHNPTNFEPSDYDVLDYLDNQRPPYYGQDAQWHAQEVKAWEDEMKHYFGPDYHKHIHHCVHCGNGRVRWITVVKHLPTGNVVVFGSDCTHRLGFANKLEWKLAMLKSKAEAGHAKMKIWKRRVAFLEANPALATAVEQAKNPVHANNTFVHDVISKLNQYGDLSVRQVEAVLKSLQRDLDKAVDVVEVKGNAPTGHVTVTGVVLSVKSVEGYYGWQTKMLLKLDNNSRVWLTMPKGADADKGDTLTVSATFEVSKDDVSFAFGKRPHLVKVVKAVAA